MMMPSARAGATSSSGATIASISNAGNSQDERVRRWCIFASLAADETPLVSVLPLKTEDIDEWFPVGRLVSADRTVRDTGVLTG